MQPPRLVRPWKPATRCGARMCAALAASLLILLPSATATAQRNQPTTHEGILELLELSPGMSAADVGAGAGELALLMAERVGANGRVFANEISRNMLDTIDRKIAAGRLQNVTTILGEETDPRLPAQVDVMVLEFVYHHLSQPLEFMQNARKYLKPSGRVFVAAEDIARVREIDPELKRHQEACVSDPAATAAAIEKAGYVFEKLEHLDRINRKIYVLTLRPSQDPETTTTVPELETLHEIIAPLWHDAWPRKDVAALRRFVPEIEARAAKLYVAALPGILREMKAKWDRGMAALRASVEAYRAAAAGPNDQQLLDAAEAVHARFEELFYGVLRPLPPAVDAFHKVLYVVYHRHLPNREYARIGPAAEEMVVRAEAVRKARLPARLSGSTATYQQAAEALHAAAAELLAATRTGDGAAIERAVEALHTRYQALQKIFE